MSRKRMPSALEATFCEKKLTLRLHGTRRHRRYRDNCEMEIGRVDLVPMMFEGGKFTLTAHWHLPGGTIVGDAKWSAQEALDSLREMTIGLVQDIQIVFHRAGLAAKRQTTPHLLRDEVEP